MTERLNVLALESYYGGSHKAFIDGWIERSVHNWTLLTLPPNKWKWRMRHSAITFAGMSELKGEFDVLFCSDMMNLAEFRTLAPENIRNLPSVIYFHENQLTYPVTEEREWDYHFIFTNMVSAMAADQVWFNSEYHRDVFLDNLKPFLKKMPDYQPLEVIDSIFDKSSVKHPGIEEMHDHQPREAGPLHIVWSGRWEHDKNPEEFFEALTILKKNGTDFKLSVLGESFRQTPKIFAEAEREFSDNIINWGYKESREEFKEVLSKSDVFVSTAGHEFFGISAVEAALSGAFPVLPERLSYPEIFKLKEGNEEFFYNGGSEALAARLKELAGKIEKGECLRNCSDLVEKYLWKTAVPIFDKALAEL